MSKLAGTAQKHTKRIVIVNGEFAGVMLAQRLECLLPTSTKIGTAYSASSGPWFA